MTITIRSGPGSTLGVEDGKRLAALPGTWFQPLTQNPMQGNRGYRVVLRDGTEQRISSATFAKVRKAFEWNVDQAQRPWTYRVKGPKI